MAATIQGSDRSTSALDFLCCPRTRLPLARDGDDRLVTDTEDPDKRFVYPVIDGLPILVDFDSSVLDEADTLARGGLSPHVRREYRGLAARAKGLAGPVNPRSERNIGAFTEALKALNPRPRVLVVGGATMGSATESLYADPTIDLVGFDIYRSSLTDFIADAHSIPVKDAAFDGVLVQAVLEHVLDPGAVVAKIHRVLAPAGIVYSETPFLQQVHEGAYDFTRYTVSGHRYLFRWFELIGVGSPRCCRQPDAVDDRLLRPKPVPVSEGRQGREAGLLLASPTRSDDPERYAFDSTTGTYFLGRKAERGSTPAEIVAHYRGAG